jgi:hypothetical protein
MIKKKEMVSFTGRMVENIKEAGKMGSSMESVPTHLQVVKPNRANGQKVKDFTGFQTMESDSIVIANFQQLISSIFFVKIIRLVNKIWWIVVHLNCFVYVLIFFI